MPQFLYQLFSVSSPESIDPQNNSSFRMIYFYKYTKQYPFLQFRKLSERTKQLIKRLNYEFNTFLIYICAKVKSKIKIITRSEISAFEHRFNPLSDSIIVFKQTDV